MSYISTNSMKNSTIIMMYASKDEIELDPSYQRMGDVWNKSKKQLLIDSILNDYDIPKIYFRSYKNESSLKYAVIDGRQRLETIWSFIEGEYPLSEDFKLQRDDSVNIAGKTYDQIAMEYPRLKIEFDSFVLPIVLVETDDDELIEDMFSRLNEAVPLNSAEKRNSTGGDFIRRVRDLSSHEFFVKKVKFSNKRYQHYEVCSRIMLVEDCIRNETGLIDTKKTNLDRIALDYKQGKRSIVDQIYNDISSVLDVMCDCFDDDDGLLKSQGNMVLYYLVFKCAINSGSLEKINRDLFIRFQEDLKRNRDIAAEDNEYERPQYDLLEYDRLTQQGTNDASNIKERLKTLMNSLKLGEISIPL